MICVKLKRTTTCGTGQHRACTRVHHRAGTASTRNQAVSNLLQFAVNGQMQCASCAFTGKRTVKQLLLIGLPQACQLAACSAQADERTVADIQYLGRGAGVAGLGQGLTVPVYDGALDGLAALRFLGKFSPPVFDVFFFSRGDSSRLLENLPVVAARPTAAAAPRNARREKYFRGRFSIFNSPLFLLWSKARLLPSSSNSR